MTFRSRKLLDLAHDFHTCQNCGCHVEAGCEPAHSNMSEHGKGISIKSADCYFAALCHSCHSWLDQGSGLDPSGVWEADIFSKRGMWRKAFDKTLLELWSRGLLAIRA